jgi:hypothetical protein
LVRWTRRAASAVLAVTTTLALTAPAALAAPTTTDDPTEAAAGWLANQLVDGERIETEWGGDTYPDQGLTADVVFALAGAGVAADEIDAATDWLESQVTAYTGTAWGDVYAGAVGKLLVVAATTGRSVTDFGGADLVALLEEREDEESGRYSDQTEGDWSNTITQSLGILGLHRTTDEGPSDTAVAYLARQACPDGGFPSQLEPATCTSDVDATAFAVQALLPIDAPEHDVVVDAAVSWLLATQGSDGSFGGPDSPANANSTGLAATALLAAGENAAAQTARVFLLGLQEGCEGEQPGAIDFDAASPGDRTRASAQAVLGLVDVGLATVSSQGASNDVPLLDCDEEAGTTDPDGDGTTGPGTEDPDPAVEAELDVEPAGEEPREGTEAAPGEMPRTGSQPLSIALLGSAILGAGVLTLRRTTTS